MKVILWSIVVLIIIFCVIMPIIIWISSMPLIRKTKKTSEEARKQRNLIQS